jgi:hypothetical protein
MLLPDTEGSHHVPHGSTVDRGSPRNLHSIQRGPMSISSWAHVWQAPKDPWWPTDSDCWPRESSTSHHQAPPASDQFWQHTTLSQLHLCTVTSRIVRMSSPVRIQCAGLWSPLQQPQPGLVTEREDTVTPRAQEAHHGVNWQGQAGLHPQWDWPREEHLQSTGQCNPGCSTTCHAVTAHHMNYVLQPPHIILLFSTFEQPSLRGMISEPPTVKQALPIILLFQNPVALKYLFIVLFFFSL